MCADFPLSANKRYFDNQFIVPKDVGKDIVPTREHVLRHLFPAVEAIYTNYSPETALKYDNSWKVGLLQCVKASSHRNCFCSPIASSRSKDFTIYTGCGGEWVALDRLLHSSAPWIQREHEKLKKYQNEYFNILETLVADYEKSAFVE
jgi:hypothetical protein